ncbi:12020_t:CDS:10 [Acaulospora colombiana]|uniref:12020_t:CDS:1 n=1 Tax=Acaulospora colombiana TaxID=27376 RepID=A0ACA9KZT2_9GLOM|nr:12020_t:CDS:10 [Acaulospora colombiana]
MSNRWMSIRMGVIGVFAAYIAGYLILWHHDRIDAGLAGFCLSYALGFVQIVFMLVKDYTTMETSLSSAERIKEYIDMPQEFSNTISNAHPPAAWPTSGEIEVSDLVVKYSQNEEPVLHDISFTIYDEEKIGIVGRTGSGKTTLVNSFLRLTEPSEGRIVIDGIDISKISLEDLRSRLTVISQDIRGEYSDHELWESLRRVHLVHIEESSPNGQLLIIGPITSLEDPINEGGINFSRGQRQLLCLARTLLRQSKIIIMDEATASIDAETDNRIQEIIGDEFRHATVLCISHRLKTVMDSNRILVLDEGVIAEFDTPYRLINNPDSLFRYLCEQSGELESLTEMARLNNPDEDDAEAEEENDAEVDDDYQTERESVQLENELENETETDGAEQSALF